MLISLAKQVLSGSVQVIIICVINFYFIYRKTCIEPHIVSKKFAAGSAVTASDLTSKDVGEYAHHSPRRQQQQQQNKSCFGVRHFSRTPFNPAADTTGQDSDTAARTLSPPRGGRQKPMEEEPERGILDSVKERLKPVCAPQNGEEYFHRTASMYYVPWRVPLSPQTRISPKKPQNEVSGKEDMFDV